MYPNNLYKELDILPEDQIIDKGSIIIYKILPPDTEFIKLELVSSATPMDKIRYCSKDAFLKYYTQTRFKAQDHIITTEEFTKAKGNPFKFDKIVISSKFDTKRQEKLTIPLTYSYTITLLLDETGRLRTNPKFPPPYEIKKHRWELNQCCNSPKKKRVDMIYSYFYVCENCGKEI